MLTDIAGNRFVVDEKLNRTAPGTFLGVSKRDYPQEPQFSVFRPGKVSECSIPFCLDDLKQEVRTSADDHPLYRSWFSFCHKYGQGRALSGDEPEYPTGKWNEPQTEDGVAAIGAMLCFILAAGLGGSIGYGLSWIAQWLSSASISTTLDGIGGSIQYGFQALVWWIIVLFITGNIVLYALVVSHWAMGESVDRYSSDRGFYTGICWLIALSCGGLFVVHCYLRAAKYEFLPPLMIGAVAILGLLVGSRIGGMIVDKAKYAREARQEKHGGNGKRNMIARFRPGERNVRICSLTSPSPRHSVERFDQIFGRR